MLACRALLERSLYGLTSTLILGAIEFRMRKALSSFSGIHCTRGLCQNQNLVLPILPVHSIPTISRVAKSPSTMYNIRLIIPRSLGLATPDTEAKRTEQGAKIVDSFHISIGQARADSIIRQYGLYAMASFLATQHWSVCPGMIITVDIGR